MSKEIWARVDGINNKEERKDLIKSIIQLGIKKVIVRSEDTDFRTFKKIKLYFNNGGYTFGGAVIVDIKTPQDQNRVIDIMCKYNEVIINMNSCAIVSIENLIAKSREYNTKILACVDNIEQTQLCLNVLEKGVDGIVINTMDLNSMRTLMDTINKIDSINLTAVSIIDTINIEVGDRVCIDTVSMMIPGEGMLIGSQSSCLFLVQSESDDDGYISSRPFRVNAGAIHSYILTPGDKVRYLSELRSGDPLIIVNSNGSTRISSVGRCKIEQRPLLLLKATDNNNEYSVILQNAETVKLIGPNGSLPITSINIGDKVYVKLEKESNGRHFGMKIKENVREI